MKNSQREMLLVKNIEVELVPENIIEIKQKNLTYEHGSSPHEELNLLIERVRGQRFINSRGQQLCIGMSKKVQDAIGLPFEAYEGMRGEIESLRRINARLENELVQLKSYADRFTDASLKDRLKYLFTGKI